MRESRKMDHIRYALSLGPSGENGFSDIRFVHNCLPGVSMDQIALDTTIGDLKLSSPIVINAMTGGAHETEEINRELAVAARELKLAMAVGSQMTALRNPDVESSYKVVRKVNPNGIVFANLGGEATVEQALRAVDMLNANALQIHLNCMQELIMPEGDRDFRGTLERIAEISDKLPIPVIVKEVGFGMSAECAVRLKEIGIRIIDIGGAGGTNFAAIENARRDIPLSSLNDWGIPTCSSLIECSQVYPYGGIIASGGITDSLDIAKALALGASAAGIAGAFLKVLRQDGTQPLIDTIKRTENGLRLIMTALGSPNIPSLWNVPLVIGGATAEWCRARGIDARTYGCRRPV